MPKCVKCNEFFSPNYTDIIEGSERDSKGEYPQQCVFCKMELTEVERETEHNSGEFVKYTKEQCIKDYKIFMQKFAKSKNVKEILRQNDDIKIMKMVNGMVK